MELRDYIRKDNIIFLKSKNKEKAIREICKFMSEQGLVSEELGIEKKLMEREKVLSTGIGNGLAIPHTRIIGINDFIVVVGIAKDSLKYESLDENPVHVIITVIIPEHKNQEYMKLVTQIVLHFKDSQYVKEILGLNTVEEVYSFLSK